MNPIFCIPFRSKLVRWDNTWQPDFDRICSQIRINEKRMETAGFSNGRD
jgi:hypothetical protein